MFNNKKLIFVILAVTIVVLAVFSQFKERFRKLPSLKPTEEITPSASPFPTWFPKPGVKRPTITYEKFPFKSTDKTRKVEIIGCIVDNTAWGMSYPKKVVEILNVSSVATETMKAFLKEAFENGWGGFPSKVKISLKKLTIDKFGTARVYFSKEIQAYGGGAARIVCMHDSVELTLKQFPTIKNVIMCIEDTCEDQKGAEIFQP